MVSLTVPNNFLSRTIRNAKPTVMEGFVHGAFLRGACVAFRHFNAKSTIVSRFCQTRGPAWGMKCARFEASGQMTRAWSQAILQACVRPTWDAQGGVCRVDCFWGYSLLGTLDRPLRFLHLLRPLGESDLLLLWCSPAIDSNVQAPARPAFCGDIPTSRWTVGR